MNLYLALNMQTIIELVILEGRAMFSPEGTNHAGVISYVPTQEGCFKMQNPPLKPEYITPVLMKKLKFDQLVMMKHYYFVPIGPWKAPRCSLATFASKKKSKGFH